MHHLGFVVWIFIFYFKYKFLYANSVDPEQSPPSVAPDLSLHCWPMPNLWDAWHIWVKQMFRFKTVLKGHIQRMF